jgi:hypothetical protein
MLKIAQTAVDKFAAAGRSGRGKIVHLTQNNPKPPACGVHGNSGAVYAAPDHQNIALRGGSVRVA